MGVDRHDVLMSQGTRIKDNATSVLPSQTRASTQKTSRAEVRSLTVQDQNLRDHFLGSEPDPDESEFTIGVYMPEVADRMKRSL